MKRSPYSRRTFTAKRSGVRKSGGYAFNPPKDPPMSNTSQFKKIRLEIGKLTDVGLENWLKISDIVSSLREALGMGDNITTNETLSMRLIRMMCYAPATSGNSIPRLTVSPVSPVPNTNDTTTTGASNPSRYCYVANLKDSGTFDSPAKVGWCYSDTDRNYTFHATRLSDENFIAALQLGNVTNVQYIIDIEYAFNLGEVPPVDSV